MTRFVHMSVKVHVQKDRHVQMYMYMDMDILYHRMKIMVAVQNIDWNPKKVKKRRKSRILTGFQLKYNFSVQQLYCVKNNCTIRFSQISKYNTIYNFSRKIVLYCMLHSAALMSSINSICRKTRVDHVIFGSESGFVYMLSIKLNCDEIVVKMKFSGQLFFAELTLWFFVLNQVILFFTRAQ